MIAYLDKAYDAAIEVRTCLRVYQSFRDGTKEHDKALEELLKAQAVFYDIVTPAFFITLKDQLDKNK